MERISICVVDIQTTVTCRRIQKGDRRFQRIQRLCSNTAKKCRYIPRQTRSQQLKEHTSKKHRFINLLSCNFCSVWGPNPGQAPVGATHFCFTWRGSPLPTYHPPKGTTRERYESWCWILGSDRSNGMSLLGAETPDSSMKRQLPASLLQFHHPPLFA